MSIYELKKIGRSQCLIVEGYDIKAKDWLAELTGFDAKYGYARKFVRGLPYSKSSSVFILEKDKLYQYSFKYNKGFLVLRANDTLQEPELQDVYTLLHIAAQNDGKMNVEDHYNPPTATAQATSRFCLEAVDTEPEPPPNKFRP